MRFLFYVFLICIAAPAQAATFDIDFFEGNTHVGNGTFEIAFGRSVFVPCGYDGCVDKKNPVFGFAVYVKGMVWEQKPDPESAVDLWWSAPGQEPGIGPHGKIAGIIEGGWDFGDTITRKENFSMTFLEATSNSGSGTWDQSVFDTPSGIPEFAGGKWTATVVPVPAALWLFSYGLISLGFYQKGRKRFGR